MKILAIKFKFLGDIAIMVPSLRALRAQFPKAQIDVLIPHNARDILHKCPYINKIHTLPRSKKLLSTLRQLFCLQQNNYDLSIDFVGNDRGAIASLIIAATTSLGPQSTRGFIGRDRCYTHTIQELTENIHEIDRNLGLLKRLNIPPQSGDPELYANPDIAQQFPLPDNPILCSLSTSASSKEWPIQQWAYFYTEFPDIADRLAFTTGPSKRELELLLELKLLIPNAHFIEPIPTIAELMTLISRCDAVISGDTFTAHAAAGLGTPLLSLIGPTNPVQWHPKGRTYLLEAQNCQCKDFFYKCSAKTHCLSTLQPKRVYNTLLSLLSHYGKTTDQLSHHCKK